MVVIKNGRGLLGLGTQKSAVSQEWINELGSFVACWCKFMKAKSYFNNYWVGVVKNEQGLKDRGTLKPGTSHKWFDELSRLNNLCMLIVMEYYFFALNDTSYWLYENCMCRKVMGRNAHHRSDCRIF